MSRFKLPGSSLLDRCIGRSTFQHTAAIKLNPFAHNLSYDTFIKTISKYEPTNYSNSWCYTTPFGRKNICRINLGSSRRTIKLQYNPNDGKENETKENNPTHMELYEYCVGSIRNSMLTIQKTTLLPSKIHDFILDKQYKCACYFAEKRSGSILDAFFDSMYRIKLVDKSTFTSTQPNFFPKWCSSITLVRVLKSKNLDFKEFVDKLNENDKGKLAGKSNVNLSKDIDYDLKQENKETLDKMEFPMKGEYQSDFIRHFEEIAKFENNYECNELYLVLSTRYVIASNSMIWKLVFMPHWLTVQFLSGLRHKTVLKDLSDYLRFMAEKDAENDRENPLHKQRPNKKKKRKKTD